MKFPKEIVEEFRKYLTENNKLLPTPILDKEQQIEDFKNGIRFIEEVFAQKKMSECSAQELVTFIKNLHRKVAHSVYNTKSIEHPAGNFRQDISAVLRHPPMKAPYRAANEPGRMAVYLKSQFGPEIALDFLIGYFKFFISPTEDLRLKSSIMIFAKNHHLLVEPSRFLGPLTNEESFALDKIYKLFISHEQIPQAIFQWASELLNALDKKEDPIEVFAIYYLRFIEIHPFADANSRVAKILLNTILIELGYQPSLFGGHESKFYYEHFFNKSSPDISAFAEHLRKLCMPFPSVQKTSAKGIFEALSTIKIESSESTPDPTDKFEFYNPNNKEFSRVWKEISKQSPINEGEEVWSVIHSKPI